MPAGIHIGAGPPGVIYLGAAGYRARMHVDVQFRMSYEDVLDRESAVLTTSSLVLADRSVVDASSGSSAYSALSASIGSTDVARRAGT